MFSAESCICDREVVTYLADLLESWHLGGDSITSKIISRISLMNLPHKSSRVSASRMARGDSSGAAPRFPPWFPSRSSGSRLVLDLDPGTASRTWRLQNPANSEPRVTRAVTMVIYIYGTHFNGCSWGGWWALKDNCKGDKGMEKSRVPRWRNQHSIRISDGKWKSTRMSFG